jgi:hypothetical protein
MFSVAAAAALLPLFVGCSSQRSQVARAQSPSGQYVTAYGDEVCDDDCYDQGRRHRCKHCGGRGCSACCRPYHVPTDLSYPPASPMAIVQYPYYTCKGPDCFFWPPLR